MIGFFLLLLLAVNLGVATKALCAWVLSVNDLDYPE